MKNVFYFISLLILIMTASCGKTEISQGIGTQATLFNKSGVRIKYIPFYKGIPVLEYAFEIENNDSFFLGNYHSKASGKAPGFLSPYGTGMDSIRIVYNDRYIITHVWNYPDSLLQPHQLPYTNDRNVGNVKNYVWWFEESTRTSIHEFTFTPEDYEYGQENGIE